MLCCVLQLRHTTSVNVRLVTDFTYINKRVVRPVHPFPSSADIMQAIPPDAYIFAKLGAVHGYFQLALAKVSADLTTLYYLPFGSDISKPP